VRRAACAARRDGETQLVERQEQLDCLAFLTREAQAEMSGQAAMAMTDQIGTRDAAV